ncbi:MalY/PatB family protein [Ferrimonas balearica]|uniref:MalY/PatB family protein n=1 Tax=Ferrimonas balearica TaxID=44012 RepID=UPI001C996D03|nr:aminotransferase class I/II-fold pyridoxal phosphate-dependent enzyme [Ferrimonas balearica]MBY5991292.1 aminotransferase class I/II-fold pyridoxal phosphate-dependent enzyme [Ferrimonas balearica]
MAWNFDQGVDRTQSDSIKWGRYRGRDVLPLWVADMDFAVAPPIQQAIEARARHGVFGYAAVPPSLLEAASEWLKRRWDWTVPTAHLVPLPAVIPGANLAVRALELAPHLTWPTPVYDPLAQVAENLSLPATPFDITEGGTWDLASLDRAIAAGANTVLLSNPHNPIGSRFDLAQYQGLAKRVQVHGLTVISDDIHGDLLLSPGARHRPLAQQCPEIAERVITLISPGKAFNLAGLPFALAVVPCHRLRRQLKTRLRGQTPAGNVVAMAAAEAAYREGEPWLDSLLGYLHGNAQYLAEGIAAIPGVRMVMPEATYLAWLDCRALGWEKPAQVLEAHGLGLSDGSEFRAEPGFARLNFGCPRATLEAALARLAQAVASA